MSRTPPKAPEQRAAWWVTGTSCCNDCLPDTIRTAMIVANDWRVYINMRHLNYELCMLRDGVEDQAAIAMQALDDMRKNRDAIEAKATHGLVEEHGRCLICGLRGQEHYDRGDKP